MPCRAADGGHVTSPTGSPSTRPHRDLAESRSVTRNMVRVGHHEIVDVNVPQYFHRF